MTIQKRIHFKLLEHLQAFPNNTEEHKISRCHSCAEFREKNTVTLSFDYNIIDSVTSLNKNIDKIFYRANVKILSPVAKNCV